MMARLFFLFLLLTQFSLYSQSPTVKSLMVNGSLESRINLVILGDGYQEHELDKFEADAVKIADDFFDESPYREYKSYFNTYVVSVASNESGAASDPSNLIDNYYGSTYNFAGIQRLLVATRSARITGILANHFPQYDQVIMLVNDSRYGGSGGWIATASTHTSSSELVRHEIGHSFASLADEYYAGDQYASERANMTRNTDPTTVKWKNWMGFGGIGIYQHCCGGNSAQWYRPHENCKMRFLNRDFCSVCSQTTIAKIHSLTNPILSYSPDSVEEQTNEDTLQFSLQLIEPNPNTLSVRWTLNGEHISNELFDVNIPLVEVPDGENKLQALVIDTTAFIRIDNYELINFYSVIWNWDQESSTSTELTANSSFTSLKLYPIPAQHDINLEFQKPVTGSMKLDFYTIQGVLLDAHSIRMENELSTKVLIPNSPDPFLYLHVHLNGALLYTGKVLRH
jgi:hypothetical protein